MRTLNELREELNQKLQELQLCAEREAWSHERFSAEHDTLLRCFENEAFEKQCQEWKR